MQVMGILCLVAMAAVSAVVGLRLLSLGRRTQQLPELSMGLALIFLTVLGGPVSALGRLPGLIATPPGNILLGTGLAFALAGVALSYVFTWRVFRPDAFWATCLVVLAAAVLGVEWLGLVSASAHGRTMEEILPHTRPWALAIVAMVALSFLWSALESLAYHRQLRRRLGLGLADPVVVNRFWLWTVAGFATVVVCGVIAGSILAGLAPLRHPLPLASVAVCAITASLCWYLAFLPPQRYLRRVRQAAA